MKKRKGKKDLKKLIPGIIAVVVCIVALILVGSISSPVLRTILTIALIAGILVAALAALLVVFGNKASQESAAPKSSVNHAPSLTSEQSESLKKAGSQLTRIRMGINRFTDRELANDGIAACDAVDKVLKTLKEKPEKIQTTRQLFNYYLPTMEQVVDRYAKLETSGVDNPAIPGNVKKYFGDITAAMESQYEGLFDNDKLNVTVDMEAMTIALRRDGLLDDADFRSGKAKETVAEAAGTVEATEKAAERAVAGATEAATASAGVATAAAAAGEATTHSA